MMIASCQYTRWYTCILLLCLCHNGLCTVGASDTQSNQRERAFAEDKKHRTLIMRGQNSQPIGRAVNEDGMTAKQIAKMRQVDKKRMQMLSRRKKKQSLERNKIRTNRGRIKPQYDGQSNTNPPPKMGPPPPPPPSDVVVDGQYGPAQMDGPLPLPPQMTEAGQYGPLPPNSDVPPPPPMRPPPPMWEGTGYGPPPMRGSKPSKPISYGSNIKPPIKPGYPPHGPFPPDNSYPPHFPEPHKPTSYPTYMPTKDQEEEVKGVRITVQGLLNTYGLGFPFSSEQYDAMVTVFAQTIYESASVSLADNQMLMDPVRILEIEGITPQFSGGSRRQLQNADSNSFQCRIDKQKRCCEREPTQGSENPTQFCESLGCNINDCRRIRFDIIAEQNSFDRQLQSQQSQVDELYTTITKSITQQIDSGAFAILLKENASQCGEMCIKPFARVSMISAVFAPPTDITVRTSRPMPRPTRKPAKEPLIAYPVSCHCTQLNLFCLIHSFYLHCCLKKTTYPTLSPTRNPVSLVILFTCNLPSSDN